MLQFTILYNTTTFQKSLKGLTLVIETFIIFYVLGFIKVIVLLRLSV